MRTLVPVLQHRVWGGQYLAQVFPDAQAKPPVGEAWLLSDHPTARTLDEQGRALSEMVPDRPWFPVLIKILHAVTDLSVQVHPNDEQAKAIGDLGKTEGWLILSATPGARICYGHHAQSPEQLREAAASGTLDTWLRYTEVSAGQYFPVPAGTVHALGGGIVALEVQQASDTTYRLYDYHRKDTNGELRALHVDEGIAVTAFPQPPLPEQGARVPHDGLIEYENHAYYGVATADVDGAFTHAAVPDRLLCVVLLDGEVAPTSFPRRPTPFQTWVFEEGEAVSLRGTGRVAIVQIPLH
ncbi:MAG: class I mannose-6-phosphate isomerase [Firmicutes bacterium]|nr:class I mannose-6-phosphate isomerase [Bacillota bacterium]